MDSLQSKEHRLKPKNTSALFALLLVLLTVAVPTKSLAQVSFDSFNQNRNASVIDEEDVTRTARDAFNQTLHTEIAATNLAASNTQPFINTLKAAFSRELAVTINELKGDGVLEVNEVRRELKVLRERHLNTFRNGLSALQDGKAPPPARGSDSWSDHALKLLSYTFTQRNQLTDWAVLAATIISGLFAAWMSSKALRGLAQRFERRNRTLVADLTMSLIGPVYLVAITLALHVASQSVWIPGVASTAIDQLVVILLSSALFWFLWQACASAARGVTWLIEKTYQTEPDEHMMLIVSRLLRFALVALFGSVFVKQVLDSNLTGFIAGLGVLGVALSFILRGTIENIAASFTIFGDKPFRVGDLIIYDEQWGRVEDIGFRSTRFRTLKGHLITIPNSNLVDDAIQNVGSRPTIRRRFRVGIPYGTPPQKIDEAMQIIRELLDKNEAQPEDKPAAVVLEEFGDYSLQLMVEYHFAPADFWTAMEYDSAFNLNLLSKFNEAGIEFALPTQKIHMHGDDMPGLDRVRDKGEGSGSGESKRNLESISGRRESFSG